MKAILKEQLIQQINDAPQPLKSYINSLEAGCDSSLHWLNLQLKQENEEMKHIFNSHMESCLQ